MLLTTGIVLDLLSRCGPVIAGTEAHILSFHAYQTFRTLNTSLKNLSGQSVYICDAGCYERLLEIDAITPQMLFLVINEENRPVEDTGSVNFVEIRGVTRDALYYSLMELFQELNRWERELLAAIVQQQSIQELALIGQNILVNPFIILDNRFQLLAYSDNITPQNIDFQQTIECGYPPLPVISRLVQHAAPHISRQSIPNTNNELSIAEENEFYPFKRIIVTVRTTDLSCVAQIMIHSLILQPTTGYIDLLNYFSNIIYLYLKKNPCSLVQSSVAECDYEQTLLQLVLGTITGESADNIESILNLPQEGTFQLFVMDLPQNLPPTYSLTRLRRDFPDIRCLLYTDALIGIVGCNFKRANGLKFISGKMENISEFSRNLGSSSIGYSQVYFSIFETKSAFEQATFSVQMWKKLKNSSSQFSRHMVLGEELLQSPQYSDYYIYHLISCSGDKLNLRSLVMPELLSVLDYDSIHGTEYYRILYSYFEYGQKTSVTAEKLHMHRNNVNYHLKRILEMFNINAYDPQQKTHLQLSMRILDVLEE